jgi:hypothetical protein
VVSTAAGIPTDQVTVLYRPESGTAPQRLDPAVQAATLALERRFIDMRYRVLQPTPETYRILDQGQAVIVTFAPDAGFSLVFSAYKSMRAMPGADAGIAEVRLQARVFVGREILVADTGRGQMMTRLDPDNREFGERRAYEQAAEKAAQALAERTVAALQALTPERIAQLMQSLPSVSPTAVAVPTPLPPAAPAPSATAAAQSPATDTSQPPAPVPPSGAAPSPPPVPGPTPAPALATSPAAPLPPPARRFAIVVGVSDYGSVRNRLRLEPNDCSDLPGVAKDVGNVEQTLLKLGFPAGNIRSLRDARATSTALRGELKTLVGQCQPDDLVLIFISAHGGNRHLGPSGFGMPILSDFVPDNPDLLDFWELQSLVGNLPARRAVLMVDTCHSGGVTQRMPTVVVGSTGVSSSADTVAPNAAALAQAAGAARHVAILTASQAREISWEDGANGGLFTSRMLRGLLRTEGKAPIQEVFERHVQAEVIEASRRICERARACSKHPVQTPVLAYSGLGNQIRL